MCKESIPVHVGAWLFWIGCYKSQWKPQSAQVLPLGVFVDEIHHAVYTVVC